MLGDQALGLGGKLLDAAMKTFSYGQRAAFGAIGETVRLIELCARRTPG